MLEKDSTDDVFIIWKVMSALSSGTSARILTTRSEMSSQQPLETEESRRRRLQNYRLKDIPDDGVLENVE
jgi:hypothetical protein